MAKSYFWRNTQQQQQQQQINYVETVVDEVNSYEFKWEKGNCHKFFRIIIKGVFEGLIFGDFFQDFISF